MGNNWTKEQTAVIEHRNGNLLVAAAAGSGKTAVLTERILKMISDPVHPIDIDSLLVVTFSRAAAAEMRERIGKKITDYVDANPDDRHMQRQGALLHNASICTIDSFCLQVVREFFHVIDLDPSFRIGDDSEMSILKSDVMGELLEKRYEAGNPDDYSFFECFAQGRTDSETENLILKLYEASESNPYPAEWLDSCLSECELNSASDLENCEYIKKIVKNVRNIVSSLIKNAQYALNLSNEPDGPLAYSNTFINEIRMLKDVEKAGTYAEMSRALKAVSFERMSPVGKKDNVDPVKKDTAKNIRDKYSKRIKEIIAGYFDFTPEEMTSLQNMTLKSTEVLVGLVKEFAQRLSDAKKEKGIYSFNDIEHLALNILVKHDETGDKLTDAAKSLRDRFNEIIVDEYQDSNLLQESILNAISRKSLVTPEFPEGRPNIFMVGDVKQSIYRFRRARPDLFMEKFETYSENTGMYRKILLRKNFRSRFQVLDATNIIFEWCMHKFFGRVEYDPDAALYLGNESYPDKNNEKYNPELIIAQTDGFEDEDAPKKIFAEAKAVAKRIKELVSEKDGILVTKEDKLTPAKYSDIAILLRSSKDWTDVFTKVLSDEGIPVRSEVKTGFFNTGEVKTTLNYFKCLNNPKEDIPFASILFSPILHLSNDEIAGLKFKGEFLFDSVKKIVNCYRSGTQIPGNRKYSRELLEKLSGFLDTFEFLRMRRTILSVSDLLDEFYRATGMYKICLSLPAGERRAANLDLLREQAVNFEKTSYSGVFNFIRYVRAMQEHEIDFGEASGADFGNAVRIMTIHASKGLEFPIVFVPQLFKKFNNMDSNTTVPIHPELGPGFECVDEEVRTRTNTLRRRFISDDLKFENIAEELRVFYVALTRAREKLILVGSLDKPEKAFEPNQMTGESIDYAVISKADSYFAFVKGALFPIDPERAKAVFDDLASDRKIKLTLTSASTGNKVVFDVLLFSESDVEPSELKDVFEFEAGELLAKRLFSDDCPADEVLFGKLKEAVDFEYPYEALTVKPLKLTVSELKSRAVPAELEQPENYGKPAEWVDNSGAEYGTAMHRIMELIPFDTKPDLKAVSDFIEKTVQSGLVEPESAKIVSRQKICDFLANPIAKRLACADADKKAFREQPFVFGFQDNLELSEDLNLIQGVIDLFFEEDGELVLLDYKTDHVDERTLAGRYKIQLDLYAGALSQITGKTVKEKLIYSFHNTTVINL